MYKIKLFRNMSGLVAGQSLKQMLTNKDWWKGVFGNMLSTIIGIGLTIGVGALVEHHNDKKMAKEMMLQVVKTCENDGKTIQSYDSVFTAHKQGVARLMELYMENDKEIAKIPMDSLAKYFGIINEFTVRTKGRTNVDSYFFSAQMMHQFGNANKYSRYAELVKRDQQVFEKIAAIQTLWDEQQSAFTRYLWDDPEVKTNMQALQKMAENHFFTDYYNAIYQLELSQEVAWFKFEKEQLLKLAGVTEEEYEDYKESIKLGELEGSKFKYSNDEDDVKAEKKK